MGVRNTVRSIGIHTVVEIPFDDSKWTLRITEDEASVHFDLHYGDKAEPTHETLMPKYTFEKIAKLMLGPTASE